ncbi:MAG: hypothetical protein K9N23_22690 [Akkermansiaceae bacterium]|nr:hypothetical protein [Akkermansiaceae bacterium]MCF7734509.1 hypothetical protein [Akkermansiaceae bacterium]
MAVLPIPFLCFSASCGKRETTAPDPSEPPAVESTAEAEAARIAELNARTHRLGGEIERLKSDKLGFRRQIAELEAIRSEVKDELDWAAAQKEQLSKEVEELRKRRKTELEGLLEHDVRPLEEVVKRMTREINQLLEENRDLKRKLAETNK